MNYSFAQPHLNAPTGTTPVTPNTIPAINTPQGQATLSTNMYSAQPVATAHLQDGRYVAYAPCLSHATQASDFVCIPGYAMMPYSQAHKDDPDFDSRRGFYSTNILAGTSFCGYLGHGYRGPVDRPPISTTLPQMPDNVLPQAGMPFPYKAIPVNYNVSTVDQTLPKAVPAVFTPRENLKTLEQCLSNPIYGNRNVYIRGLHPDTNDKTLAGYASLFGCVETLKAIIDKAGTCRG